MASKPLAELSPQSLRELNSLIQEMAKVTKRELEVVIRNAGTDLSFAAMKATKMARKTIRGKDIEGRGFAKAGWLKYPLSIGKARSELHKQGGAQALRFSEVKDETKRDQPSLEIANQVPYIEEMPGAGTILPLAISNTNARMARTLDRMARRTNDRWGS